MRFCQPLAFCLSVLALSISFSSSGEQVTTMNCSNCTAMTPPAAIIGSSFVPVTRPSGTSGYSMGMTGGIGGTSASYFLYSMRGPTVTETQRPALPASGGAKKDRFGSISLDEEEQRQLEQFALWLQESIPADRLGEPIFDALKVLSHVILNGPASRKEIFEAFPAAKNRAGSDIVNLRTAYETAVRAQNDVVITYVAENPKGGNNPNLDYLHANLSSLRVGIANGGASAN